jgi:hypothetical protein
MISKRSAPACWCEVDFVLKPQKQASALRRETHFISDSEFGVVGTSVVVVPFVFAGL